MCDIYKLEMFNIYESEKNRNQSNMKQDVNVKVKTGSSAIYLISIVEEPFVLINQSYIFHT